MKRPFILLEVLICLVILSAAAVYLFRDPLRTLKAEWNALQELEFRRLWQSELMALEEALPEICPQLKLASSPSKENLWRTPFFKDWPPELKPSYYLFCTGKKEDTSATYYKVKVYEKKFWGQTKHSSKSKRAKVADGSYEFCLTVPK